jgi:hypothetical protein
MAAGRSSLARRNSWQAVDGDRRFGGVVLGAARQAKYGALALTGAGSPCHSIIIYTPSTCTSSLALFVLTAYPSLADRLLPFTPSRFIAASPTSHLSHVPQQLRQRFGHLVCAHLICYLSASAKPVSPSSPQGRIFQVEYAQEAVKQGSVVVGIVSKTHAVLAAVKVRRETLPSAPSPLLTLSSTA